MLNVRCSSLSGADWFLMVSFSVCAVTSGRATQFLTSHKHTLICSFDFQTLKPLIVQTFPKLSVSLNVVFPITSNSRSVVDHEKQVLFLFTAYFSILHSAERANLTWERSRNDGLPLSSIGRQRRLTNLYSFLFSCSVSSACLVMVVDLPWNRVRAPHVLILGR